MVGPRPEVENEGGALRFGEEIKPRGWKGEAVEEAGWMNEEVRAEIADMQRTHGLKGDEAVPFWHLMQARELIVALAIDRNNKLTALREKEYESTSG